MKKIINMEQIRAARALQDAPEILRARGSDGDQLSGYHSLIITNGLLATLAYSLDKKGECQQIAYSQDKKECQQIAECLIHHIAALQQEKRFPGEVLPRDVMGAINTIARTGTPELLTMVTDECMAYLNYLKRFVRALKK